MSEPKTVPSRNKSRAAGVSLNYHLTPRLEFDEAEIKVDDIFVLLLTSRHRERAGQIEEIAVGVVDSKYQTLLFYESLENFLGSHSEDHLTRSRDDTVAPPEVTLKRGVTPFIPPEYVSTDSSIDENEGTGTE